MIKTVLKIGLQHVAAIGLLASLAIALQTNTALAQAGTEGRVKFFVDAKTNFDIYTDDPMPAEQAWMRDNYYRMQTYSTYFDPRLAWYPEAWVYKDSYAIKPSWPVYSEHPEWVLKDAAGNELYIEWGCANGTCPQHAADIGNPDFRTWWIEGAASRIDIGYQGIWVDDVNLDWRISDGNGDDVIPEDPRTGQEMLLADWQRYFAEFMEELRAALPDVELAHNIIWYADSTDNPYIARQIDSADYINLERGISDGGINGGSGKYGFETFLALIDYVHSRGKNVIMDDDDDTSIAARDYELAFYYLINNGGDLLGADGDRARMNPNNFWEGYQIDLGAAKGPRYRWNGLFRRDFECGMVLVNPPDNPTVTVDLGGGFVDLAGQTVSAVSLLETSGQVLVGLMPCQNPCDPG